MPQWYFHIANLLYCYLQWSYGLTPSIDERRLSLALQGTGLPSKQQTLPSLISAKKHEHWSLSQFAFQQERETAAIYAAPFLFSWQTWALFVWLAHTGSIKCQSNIIPKRWEIGRIANVVESSCLFLDFIKFRFITSFAKGGLVQEAVVPAAERHLGKLDILKRSQ